MIQPLALGGITYGVSDLELTAAYAAIADGGQYRKPVFYTKVTDSKGNVLIDNTENKATQVFKASTASLLTNVMEDVLEKVPVLPPASTICTQPEKPVRRMRPRISSLQALHHIIPLPSGQRMIHTRSFRRATVNSTNVSGQRS